MPPLTGLLINTVGAVPTTWVIKSEQVAPISSVTVMVMVWVSAFSALVRKATSPLELGVELPRTPSLSLLHSTLSRLASTSASRALPAKATWLPSSLESPDGGPVIPQVGELLGGPTVIVVVSVPTLFPLSVTKTVN